MKHRIRFVRSMSLLLALVLLFTMSPLSVIAVSGADAEETTAERGAPEMSSPTSTPTEGTPAENGLVLVDEAIHFLDEKAGGIRELTSLREESVKHFALTNGKYAALTYPAPVHRKDQSGVWQDIDNNLSLQSFKNVDLYATSDLRVVFSQDLASSGQLFSLNENGYEIGMSMDTAQLETGELLPILPTEPSLVTVTNAPAKSGDGYYDSLAEAAAVNNAASIRYSNVKANTDLEYVLTGNAVKENIIVKARGTSYVYRFTLTLSGLTPTLLKSGVISLNDTVSGARKYIIPAPFMYDAAGNRSEDVAYALTKKSDGTYLLTVTASAAWINESDRAFPVTIDPTIYQQGAAADTYINNNYPEDLNGSGYSFIVSEEDTAYVRIALPELPENAVIDTASMYLIKESGYGSVYISARQVLGDWDEYEMTPSYAPAYSSTALSAQTVYASSGTYFGFNITSAARAWLAGTANNYGIAFVGSAIVDECISFQASDAGYYDGNDMAGPYLYVEYSEETEEPVYPVIPDGVYSFRNLHNSNYMSIQNNNPWAGGLLVTKQHSETPPTTEFARESLFKLSHVSENTYILRSMLNNNLTLGIDSDGNVITKAIPSDDDDVSIYNTFTIINVDGYYQLIPQNALSSYIGTNWDNSRLAELDYSDYSGSDQIKWTLTRYTGNHAVGGGRTASSQDYIVGNQYTFVPFVWSTFINYQTPSMRVHEPHTSITSGTWNTETQTFVASTHLPGYALIYLEMEIPTIDYLYEVYTMGMYSVLPVEEGTYFFKNVATGKYMDIINASTTVGSPIQQTSRSRDEQLRWRITHVVDGKYQIQSLYNDLCVGVDTASRVGQYNTVTDMTCWKFHQTTSGNLRITNAGIEITVNSLAVPSPASGNGVNLTLAQYFDDTLYIDEWFLHKSYDISLLALPENWNRSSYFDDILDTMEPLGYTDTYNNHLTISNGVTEAELLEHMMYSKITLVRSHGSGVVIQVTDTNGDKYLSRDDLLSMPSDTLACAELIIYGACSTGEILENGEMNLVQATVAAGARTVIGYRNSVGSGICNEWCERFFELYTEYIQLEDKSIESICENLEHILGEEYPDKYEAGEQLYTLSGDPSFPD